jgi:hypothetical protein
MITDFKIFEGFLNYKKNKRDIIFNDTINMFNDINKDIMKHIELHDIPYGIAYKYDD